MRILFLNPLSELGGAERCLLDLQASIAEADPDVEMHLAVGGPGPLVAEAERLGVRVHIVPMPGSLATVGDSAQGSTTVARSVQKALELLAAGLGALSYAGKLRHLVRSLRPDAIHSNGIKSHLLACAANRGVPIVWHIRDQIGLRPLVARVMSVLAFRASAAVAMSRLVERDARTVLRDLPIHVVYDEIDVDEYSPGQGNRPWLDEAAGFPPGLEPATRIGLVATYARWKGQDVFIDAISRVPEYVDGTPCRFYIVGGPIYETQGSQFSRDELLDRAKRLGVAHRVGFVPFQHEVAGVYRSLDIAVHASTKPEPFGRTIAEAMSCGCAVLLSRDSGVAELVPESLANTIVPGDADDMARAILRLLANESVRRQLGADCRKLAVEVFARSSLGAQVLRVLRGAVAERK